MKKIIMVLFLLLSVFVVEKVYAQTYQLTRESIYDVYFERLGGDVPAKEGIFNVFRFNGEIAYCIEPGKTITTNNYTVEDGYINLPYSDEIKNKLELIGYYGSEYPGHDGIRYIMATQALIWELTGSGDVSFYTGSDKATLIDISMERNEIMSLVNNHKTLPSIPKNINVNYYEKMEFKDNLLKDYTITDYSNNNNQEIILNDDTLIIRSKNIGDSIIEFTKKKYDNKTTLIFVGNNTNNTQKLGRFRYSEDVKFTVNVHVNGIKVKINKFNDSNRIVEIPGIKFKIKDLNTNQYLCQNDSCTYETNSSGYAVVENVNYGNYEIEEDENQIINGYAWNREKYRIDIIKGQKYNYQSGFGYYLYIDFINNKVLGTLELTKEGEKPQYNNNTISYQKIRLNNVTFSLYDINSQLIGTLKTNVNGKAKYYNLPVGKYYLQENSIPNEYQDNNQKYYFEIKQTNQYDEVIKVQLVIPNNLKKGTLEFTKVDDKKNIGIPNTIMEIYDDKNTLLLTKETDESGKIVITNLPIGKYYLKEKKANDNYQLNNEMMNFEIKENQEIIQVQMTNKKLEGHLELIKNGEELVIKDNKIIFQKKRLANVSFELYDMDNNLIDSLITNSDGYLKYDNLPIGKYYLLEKATLDNYQLDKNKYSFEIKKENNKVIDAKLEINNYLKKGTLEFTKEDMDTKVGIPNTIMEIYDDKNNLLLTKETDENGKIVITNLPIGKYYLKEKKANDNYQLNNETISFEIKENQEIVQVQMTNKKLGGHLELIKNGEELVIKDNKITFQKKRLANVSFELYDMDNNLIDSLITNSDGYLKYDNLPIGKYYLLEKATLDNYQLDKNKYSFEIKKENDKVINAKLEINNYLKKGTLEFTKEDMDTKVGIPNTIMEIYDDKNNLLLTKETDENGEIIVSDLPVGKYYLLEKEANDNYQLVNEKISFEIREHEVEKILMTNERKEIVVPKTGLNDTSIINQIFNCFMLVSGIYYGKRKKI